MHPNEISDHLNHLDKQLLNNPGEIRRRHDAARPIGRAVVNARLYNHLVQMSSIRQSSLTVNPVVPVLEYFPLPVMQNIATNGWNVNRLNLQPGAPVHKRIYQPEKLVKALPYVNGIDAETMASSLHVPFVTIKARSHGQWRYGVALEVGDEGSKHYPNGYVIEGEKEVLGPIRQGDHAREQRDPDTSPSHRIYIAEVLSDSKDKEFVLKLQNTFLELLGPVIGKVVELDSIGVVNK